MIQFWIILFLSAPRQDVSISEYGISTKKLSVTYVWCRDTKMPKFKGEFYISWKIFFCQKWEILNVFFISLKKQYKRQPLQDVFAVKLAIFLGGSDYSYYGW